jgi:hypothetical protein
MRSSKGSGFSKSDGFSVSGLNKTTIYIKFDVSMTILLSSSGKLILK